MGLVSAAAPRRTRAPRPAWTRRRPGWPAWLVAWLAFLPVAVFRAGALEEGDTFWEIRTGLLILAHRALPAVDPFSWTVRGKPWTLNSWGFDVLIALAYRVAGLTGAAWLCAVLVMVAAGLVMVLARRLGAPPAAAGVVLLLASPLLIGWLSARPQLADYIAAPALVLLLRRLASGQDRTRTLAVVGLLSVAWVNLHAGALLGVAMAGAGTALLLGRRATRGAGWWCLAATGVTLVCSFANPYGTGVIAQTEHVRAASAGIVAEWRGFSVTSPLQWIILIAGGSALLLAWHRRELVLAGALAVTAATSLAAVRFQPVLLLLAIPVLAAVLPSFPLPGPVLGYLRSRAVMFGRGGLAGVIMLAVAAVPSLTHIGRPDPAAYPVSIMRYIPRGCRLFNSYVVGSFVILARPDVPVSLDTRTDLYGRRRILADERTVRGRGDLRRELAGAGCVLVPPAAGLAARLRRDPAWQLRASDQACVLFVRRTPAPPGGGHPEPAG